MSYIKNRLIPMFAGVLLAMVLGPCTVYAHEQVVIQPTVDDANYNIVAGVVREDAGINNGNSGELKRIGKDALTDLSGNGGSLSTGASLLAGLQLTAGSGYENDKLQSNMVLTFPGKVQTMIGFSQDSTEHDQLRAATIKDILVYDLNTAFDFVYDTKPGSLGDYKTMMVNMLNAANSNSSVSGTGARFSSVTENEINKLGDPTMKASDYRKITKNGQSVIVAIRMPKGYVPVSGRTMPDNLVTIGSDSDASFITWGEIAYEAFANYCLVEKLAITTANAYSSTPTAFEEIIVNLFSHLIDFLSGALGLWTLDELIFNSGVRGSTMYIGGIFPASWEPTIWTFFYIFMTISVLLLAFGILAGIYKKVLSTVNPAMRASLMDQAKNLMVAIFLLLLMPIIFRLMISTSAVLTEISTSALGDVTAKDHFSFMAKNSNNIGSIIMSIMYLIPLLYFNFYYHIRALLVAILIMVSPLAITAYAVSDGTKNITSEWVKMVVSMIFIQPVHALICMLILTLPSSGRSFEGIVGLYAMIPLTNMLSSVAFQGVAGSMMNGAAKAGGDKAFGAVSSAVSHGAAAMGGAVVGRIGLSKGEGRLPASSESSGGEIASPGIQDKNVDQKIEGAEAPGLATAAAGASGGGASAIAASSAPAAMSALGAGTAISGVASAAKMVNEDSKSSGLASQFMAKCKSVVGDQVQMGKDFAHSVNMAVNHPVETYQSSQFKQNLDEQKQLIQENPGYYAKSLGKAGLRGLGTVAGVGLAAAGGAMSGAGLRTPLAQAGVGISSRMGELGRIAQEDRKEWREEALNDIRSRNGDTSVSTPGIDRANAFRGLSQMGSEFVKGNDVSEAYNNLSTDGNNLTEATCKEMDDGRIFIPQDNLSDAGMRVSAVEGRPEAAQVEYDVGYMSPRNVADMEALHYTAHHGSKEQKAALIDRGIKGVHKTRTRDGTPSHYSLDVNAAKVSESFGINYTADGGGVSLPNKSSFVPQMIGERTPVTVSNPGAAAASLGSEI